MIVILIAKSKGWNLANHESWQKREKIINRVIALNAMANDASSPNEAIIARKRAQKLIMQHEVSQSEINEVMGVMVKPTPKKNPQASSNARPHQRAQGNTAKTARRRANTSREVHEAILQAELRAKTLNKKVVRAKQTIQVISNLSEFLIKLFSVGLAPSLLVLFFKIQANKAYGYYEDTSTLLIYDEVARRYLVISAVLVLMIAIIVVVSTGLKKRVYSMMQNL